jgi:hypothetical protein
MTVRGRTVGGVTARGWWSGRYYCQSGGVGGISFRVVEWAVLLSEWWSGRCYCQCGGVGGITVRGGTVGGITDRVWWSGLYYGQSVVQWAILMSERGTVGGIAARVW